MKIRTIAVVDVITQYLMLFGLLLSEIKKAFYSFILDRLSMWKALIWMDRNKIQMWIFIMENLDEIIKEIRENTYDNELVDIYIRELLDREKEYD